MTEPVPEATSRSACELCDGLGEIALAASGHAVVEIPWRPGLPPWPCPRCTTPGSSSARSRE